MKQFDLTRKVALITGTDRGLGQGMALGLAEAGADVCGIGISGGEETSTIISDMGHNYFHQQLDLITCNTGAITQVVQNAVDKFGRLDILVNNAGIIRRAPLLEYTEADWDDVLQINLKSVFFLSQAAAKHMVEQGGGKIISIASMLSYQGGILVPSYTASKHGVMGITRALANELAPFNINVNAIAPGYMATDNTAALRADTERSESILARIPAGRWGTPDDLKGVVVFLASAASDYLNGCTIPVDGGWLAR